MSKARFIELDSVEGLERVISNSSEKAAVVFKHSSSCSISHSVYRTVAEVDAEIFLIVVQKARGVSDAVAVRTGIRHESPQAFIFRDGNVVYHASHYDIEAGEISRNL